MGLLKKGVGFNGYKPGENIEKGHRSRSTIDSSSRRGLGKKDQYGLRSSKRYRPKNR